MARVVLPLVIGNTGLNVYRRFRRRAENAVLLKMQETLVNEELIDADFSVLSLDSTFVKASPCAAGSLKKTGRRRSVGRRA